MSSSRSAKKQRKEELIFEKICQLARDQDLDGLKAAEKEHWRLLREKNGKRTVMQQLAFEGNEAVIQFLMDSFKYEYDHEDIIAGYAEAGLTKNVAEVIAGWKWHESYELQDHLSKHPGKTYVSKSRAAAAKGYAAGGHDAELEKLLAKHPECIHAATNAYLHVQRWEKVVELTARGGKIQKKKIPAEFYKEELFVRFMSCISDDVLRGVILADLMKTESYDIYGEAKKERNKKYHEMAKKAALLNRLISAYHISFETAMKLLELREKGELVGARTWFLQGPQVTQKRKCNKRKSRDSDDEEEEEVSEDEIIPLPELPKDLYFHIASFLIDLPRDDSVQLMEGLQANLLESVQDANIRKYTSGFFSVHQNNMKSAEAIESYERRRDFSRK